MRHTELQGNGRGLTLVELVVVVAAVVLLAAVFVPSLGYARDAARTVMCEDNLLMFGAGMLIYANDNAGYLPGTNTSGVAIRAVNGLNDPMQTSTMPVQSFDWMTPILQDQSLPDNRAARFHDLYTRFGCPQQTHAAVLYPSGLNQCPDKADFEAFADDWPACSYLMPAGFQYWGRNHLNEVLATHAANPNLWIKAQVWGEGWETSLEPSFNVRLTQVGAPARKLFVADGTRYVSALGSSLLIDIDVSPAPAYFGAFSALGGWWSGEAAYGVKARTKNWDGTTVVGGSPSNGLNLRLSYRHGLAGTAAPLPGEFQEIQRPGGGPEGGLPGSGACQDNPGMINVVCFDGHVERLNDRQSRDIDRWYPTGSVVRIPQEGMTNHPLGYVIP